MNDYKNPLKYRPEIDGLRAIAVLAVIIYHAELVVFGRDWFEGGYIGVDVFFVISGYLITRLIRSEQITQGRFSFSYFYQRRARRILPMLFMVILVSFPLAWMYLLPTDFIEYSQSILSAVFFGSNFFFYFQAIEYGAGNALMKPFLHTWSLGIEEQFYILFPVLLFLLHRYIRSYIPALLLIILLLSLQYSEYLVQRNPELSFYSPLTRFWELLTGALLAQFELERGRLENRIAAQLCPLLGLCFIVYSILGFNAETVHPGYISLIPVAGTGLIILFSNGSDLVGRVIGSKPFVALGLISYSAYLWHFPAFAFMRLTGSEPENLEKLGAIALVLMLSGLSYLLIERPFRMSRYVSLKNLIVSLTFAFLAVVGLHYAVVKSEGYSDRFGRVEGLLNFERDNRNLERLTRLLPKEKAKIGFDRSKINVLIVGNSHGKDLFNAFFQNGDLYGDYDFLWWRLDISCFDADNKDNDPFSRRFFRSDRYVESEILVISTRYNQYACYNRDDSKQRSIDFEGMPYLIKRAKSDGKGVIVFGNTTEFSGPNRQTIIDALVLEMEGTAEFSKILLDEARFERFRHDVNAEYYLRSDRKEGVNREVRDFAESGGVPFFDKHEMVCVEAQAECYGMTPNGYKAIYDYGHYTLEGAKFFGQRMFQLGMGDTLNSVTPGSD